ncbi:MAG: hypothetical protein JST81_07370 [Bacteroidetes bacterium]|nr:hypothetical protein [Bacteroidota bacterium]
MKTITLLIFALISFAFLPVENVQLMDCSKFRKGIFYYRGEADAELYRIERNDSIQKETLLSTGDYVTLKLNWVGDCEYKLAFISQHIYKNDSVSTQFQGMVLTNKIVKVTGDSCYLESRFDNQPDMVFKGVLYLAE